MKKLAIIALAAIAGAANAVVLFNNGGVVNAGETNSFGNPLSIMDFPGTAFGIQASTDANARVADNFSVGALWNVNRIDFFGYQGGQGVPPVFSFTTATFDIVSGDVQNGTVVASGTGAVSNGGFMGYRVAQNLRENRTRPIYRVTLSGLNVNLGPGSYYLRWSLAGTLASGPWVPPVVPHNPNSANAFADPGTGTFAPALDTGFNPGRPMDLPFEIHGTVVPEPASMLALGAGIAAVIARRRRK